MSEVMWQVWSEGYAATGNIETAHFHGTVRAGTFKEACRTMFKDSDYFRDGDPPRLWGCRLFDNEDDARMAFG